MRSRWQPLWYSCLQAAVVALTALNLQASTHSASPASEPTWRGLPQSLRVLSLMEPLRLVLYASLAVAVAWWGKRWDRLSRGQSHRSLGEYSFTKLEVGLGDASQAAFLHPHEDTKAMQPVPGLKRTPERTYPACPPIGRNLLAYAIVLAIDCAITSALDCGSLGLSGVPLHIQVTQLCEKWRLFHQPGFAIVRISHAFTYLPVLICLSQRSAFAFAQWRVFMLFVPDAVADWAHYLDSPEIAMQRLNFESGDLCAGIDRHFVRTVVSFPMNWVFLTTPLGTGLVQEGPA